MGALQVATSELRKMDVCVRSTRPPAAEVTVLQVLTLRTCAPINAMRATSAKCLRLP